MTEQTTRTVDVTPTFTYQQHIQILKRFIERLTAAAATAEDTDDAAAIVEYLNGALPHVRDAGSELLADDITFQIKTSLFPIPDGEVLSFHAFTPEPNTTPVEALAFDCYDCGLRRDNIVHRV